MATTAERPPATAQIVPEQRIVLRGVSWATYEALLADFVDRQAPRFAFDRGSPEIVVTLSTRHAEIKRTLELLVDLVAAELAIDVRSVGGMTFRREDLQRGFEPDSCFYIQNEARVRDREQIDPAVDPPPDLIFEIDLTRDSLPKLPLYAGLGIPEVWRYDGERVAISVLRAGTYAETDASVALPALTSEAANRFMVQSRALSRSAWVRALRDWARQQGAAERPVS